MTFSPMKSFRCKACGFVWQRKVSYGTLTCPTCHSFNIETYSPQEPMY